MTSVTYAMLRSTGPYENDRAETTVEVDYTGREICGTGDCVTEAIALAKETCRRALGAKPAAYCRDSDEDLADRACRLGLVLRISPWGLARRYELSAQVPRSCREVVVKTFDDRRSLLAYVEGREAAASPGAF